MSTAITRREIIEDEALKWGEEYSKMLQPALDKNKEFVDSIIALSEANKKLRASANDKEYILNLKQTNDLATQSTVLWKEQIQLENALISTKRKNELATEGTNKALVKERLLLAESNLEIKRQAIANGVLESSYKKLAAQVAISGSKIKDIIATGKLASESQDQYNDRLLKAQKEFDQLNSRVRAADAAVGQFNRNVGNYPQAAFDGIKKLIEAFGVVTGIQLFVSVMKDAFTTVRGFEKEIVNLAAIAGKSRDQIAPLEAKIREVAKSSINGATDVAKLATELIKLGSTPQEVEKLLEPVNNLSVALQSSAEDSATLVKSILNAFNLGAEETARITDVLAESANRSALDFNGLRDSFSYIAPASKALGISVEKTAAIIGTLADNGIKAESAGRLTSTAFARLASQGLTLEDALKKINTAQKDGSSQLEVLSLASNLFGAEAGKIGLILANNTDKIEQSTKAYENSEGALKSLTDKQLKSLDSELKILSSSWEDYVLNTNQASGATSVLTGGIRFLSGNLSTILNLIGYVALAWVGYKAAIALANVQSKLFALNLTATNAAQAENVIVTGFGTTAQVANAAATNVATGAWQRFNTAVKANALLLIIGTLAAVIYALDKFNQSIEDTVAKTKESSESFLKNREQLTKTATSTKVLSDRYSELQDKAKRLGGETKLTASEQKEMQRIVSELAKVVPGAVSSVNKYGEALKLNKKLLEEYNRENAKVLEIDKKKAINDEIQLQKDLAKSISDKTKNLKNYKEVEGQGTITTELIAQKEKELSLLKIESVLSKGRLKDLQGLTESERESAKASDQNTNTKVANSARTIKIIDDEIAAQEELVKGLSDKTGKEGRAIQSKITSLQKEREQIYSTAKADKEKTDNGLKNTKKISDAIYQLSQFGYQVAIDQNQRIIDSENSTTEAQLNALYDIAQLRKSKNEETLQYDLTRNALEKDGLDKLSKDKLEIYKKDTQNRIDQLISGKIGLDKMTSEELLIFKKYYSDIENLRLDDEAKKQALIDAEVAKVQGQIDSENQKANIELNQALKAENDKFLALNNVENQNQKERESAIEEHERRILEIKTLYAKKGIQTTIDALRKELDENAKRPEAEQLSAEQIQGIRDRLAAAEVELGNISVENYQNNADKKIAIEEYLSRAINDLQSGLTAELVNFANALFDAKIANIDYEIQKNDEYYASEIEKAGSNQRKKDDLQKQAEAKRQELEKKKRAEQYKQAVFNKAVTIAEIGLKTALAVISAAAATAPTFWGVAIASAIGALQLATAIATPLPKYKDGRKSGPAEWAVTGDGGRSEVITNSDGSNPIITPNKPTLTYLGKDDIVHKSLDDYKKYLRQSVVNDFPRQINTVREYQEKITNNKYDAELLAEMKRNTEAIKKGKPITVHQGKTLDIPHAIWASKNINWN